jgi:surface polysaccharide O-acyltransferase-like enzyme
MKKIFLAQNPLEEIENPLTSPKLTELINFIFNFLYRIGIPLFTITLLIGGYFLLTSAGDERKARSGKKTIVVSIICLILVFLLPLIKEGLLNFISEISK